MTSSAWPGALTPSGPHLTAHGGDRRGTVAVGLGAADPESSRRERGCEHPLRPGGNGPQAEFARLQTGRPALLKNARQPAIWDAADVALVGHYDGTFEGTRVRRRGRRTTSESAGL